MLIASGLLAHDDVKETTFVPASVSMNTQTTQSIALRSAKASCAQHFVCVTISDFHFHVVARLATRSGLVEEERAIDRRV